MSTCPGMMSMMWECLASVTALALPNSLGGGGDCCNKCGKWGRGRPVGEGLPRNEAVVTILDI